ncbi:MAG: hypothetical protein H0V30_05745 [Chitinophagaceae bacterium]|jgi:hypothetical protein|nr:hypothetical protein [Chitinophagaceae bacterium]
MKSEVSKNLPAYITRPEEVQIRYLMRITGISRSEMEEMLQLYGVQPRSVLEYLNMARKKGILNV